VRRPLRLLGWVMLALVGLFFVARAVAEVLTVHPGQPASYRDDWGGPIYAGVLLVHAGPGLLVLGLAALWSLRRRARGVTRRGRARTLLRRRPAGGRR
jgi:uncharacterized membrane protein